MEIEVLDNGYVRLIDTLGDDRSVVNAARVSYDKQVDTLSEKDERLLDFLWRNQHTSPFRHAALTFEVHAPLFVARQWYKHAVGSTHLDDQSGWNESSRRYVTEAPVFYVPAAYEWRTAPENKKQGSAAPLNTARGRWFTSSLYDYIDRGEELYEHAMQQGVAPELARLFLPAYGLYVRWRWTPSLHAVMHFLALRDESHAQAEIQEYASAVKELTRTKFPKSIGLLDVA